MVFFSSLFNLNFKFKGWILVSLLVFGLINFLLAPKQAKAADFNSSNLISDGEFININTMTTAQIQSFLQDQGSFLQSYSEGGRSAAQIIYDSAHGSGDASGNCSGSTVCYGIDINSTTGTVSPKVILVTLQKEQSLISKTSQDDNALRKAMGYGCPDSGGCNSAYAGFTKQVENAAWQFRYNYERAQGTGFSDYQVGQSFCFSDWNGTHCGTFDNRATSALYRYTPHVYNGNYNFWNLYYNTYNFGVDDYQASIAYWSTSDGAFTNPSLVPGGDVATITLQVKNTGRKTWTQGVVNLGTDLPQDRVSSFTRQAGWISPNRIAMSQSSVAPGETATYSFSIKAPSGMGAGTYREPFRLVADGISWVTNGGGIYWDVKVLTPAEGYRAQVAYWSTSAGTFRYPAISRGGAGTNITLNIRNTGKTTWTKNTLNLGTDQNRDRVSVFRRESGNGSPSGWVSPNRIAFAESLVAPGQTATFSFWIQASSSMSPGTYREHFNLVADGIAWLENGIYFNINVL